MPETQHPISDNALDYAVASTPAPLDDATRERLDSVLQSEVGRLLRFMLDEDRTNTQSKARRADPLDPT